MVDIAARRADARRAVTTTVDELAARTPASRDRSVDFLRAASILTVVLGHWLIGVVWIQDDTIFTTNAIGITSWLWLATWTLQVMPIFFFVGGFSNLTAYDSTRRKGGTAWSFVRTRLIRLLKPSAVFLGFWVVVQIVLHLADVGAPRPPLLPFADDTTLLRGMNFPPATVPFGPLWFLAVYLVVVAIAPVAIWLHRRFRWIVIWVMLAGAFLADILGFGVAPIFRWANVVFVLLFPHQFGFFLADGTLDRLPRRVFGGMVAAGLAGLLILTNPPLFELFGDVRHEWFPGIGAYPKSLLGTEAELVSNAYPPTLVYLMVGVWTIGAALLLRPWLQRWLQGPRPWRFTIAVNAVIMTLFLWHMTAFLLAILTLWPLGIGQQHETGARFWLEKIPYLVVAGAYLVGIVAVVGRFERPKV
jgi:peptidoglycan/LPS O-acetylase OafA/YrhL